MPSFLPVGAHYSSANYLYVTQVLSVILICLIWIEFILSFMTKVPLNIIEIKFMEHVIPRCDVR